MMNDACVSLDIQIGINGGVTTRRDAARVRYV
jgi:hypothetical protein